MREAHPIHVTVTRYVDAGGRRCKKATPGAKAVKERSEAYYAWVGGARVPLGTAELGQAWVELRKKQREAADRARGLVDDFSEHAGRPLAEHLDAWIAAVEAKGTSPKQRRLLRKSVKTLAELAGWSQLPHLSADTAVKALAALQNLKDDRYPNGRSAQTRNHYLSHLRQFVRWAIEDGRLLRNPVSSLRPIKVDADRRHDRRSPTEAEVFLLYEHLYDRRGDERPPAVRCGMTGPQRALAYKVGMATGFRAGEMRSLTRASFDLDAGAVTVRATYDKRRRPVTQHLPPWLVAELREWFDAGGGCWEGFPAYHPGRLLKDDLEAAGVPYSVPGPDGPLFFDFHSLRHFYCTWAANLPGISPRTLLAMTRHSTVQLALKTYARVKVTDVKAAVDQIPPPAAPAPRQPAAE